MAKTKEPLKEGDSFKVFMAQGRWGGDMEIWDKKPHLNTTKHSCSGECGRSYFTSQAAVGADEVAICNAWALSSFGSGEVQSHQVREITITLGPVIDLKPKQVKPRKTKGTTNG